MLELLGIPPLAEALFHRLVEHGPMTTEQLSLSSERALSECVEQLSLLRGLGLVIGGAPLWRAAKPDLAIDSLVIRRQDELERVRQSARALLERFESSHRDERSHEAATVITDLAAAWQMSVQAQTSASSHLQLMDRPPYLAEHQANSFEAEALARGVRYDVLYDHDALDSPGKGERIADSLRRGEQARLVAELPAKVLIADGRFALIYVVDGNAVTGAVQVSPSPLLDCISALFECLWRTGVSLADGPADVPVSPLTLAVLRLACAGVKDETIAKRLGIGLRSVRRHVALASEALGARNRTQAGALAAQSGWLISSA